MAVSIGVGISIHGGTEVFGRGGGAEFVDWAARRNLGQAGPAPQEPPDPPYRAGERRTRTKIGAFGFGDCRGPLLPESGVNCLAIPSRFGAAAIKCPARGKGFGRRRYRIF